MKIINKILLLFLIFAVITGIKTPILDASNLGNSYKNVGIPDEILKYIDMEKAVAQFRKELSGETIPIVAKMVYFNKTVLNDMNSELLIIKIFLGVAGRSGGGFYLIALAKKTNGIKTTIYDNLFFPECGEPDIDLSISDFGLIKNERIILLKEVKTYIGCSGVDDLVEKEIFFLNASNNFKEVYRGKSEFFNFQQSTFRNTIYRKSGCEPCKSIFVMSLETLPKTGKKIEQRYNIIWNIEKSKMIKKK